MKTVGVSKGVKAVNNREPFKATNVFGEWRGSLYVVYSYGHHWPLYVYDKNQGVWYRNGSNHSRPTAQKHRTQYAPDAETTGVTLAEMLAYIEYRRPV